MIHAGHIAAIHADRTDCGQCREGEAEEQIRKAGGCQEAKNLQQNRNKIEKQYTENKGILI